MDALISRLYSSLKKSKSKPLAVFDIDSTIFNVSPRNQVIYEAVLKEAWLKNKLKKESFDQLKSKTLSFSDWGLEPLYKVLINELSEVELKTARKFWVERFFTGEYLKYDEPYQYCIPFIQKLEEAGFYIMYLTGRDDHRMREGTLNQLKKWELPLKKDTDLITKPTKGLVDGPYKREALLNLLSTENHTWFFDNEPNVLNYCDFKDENYHLVFIDSVHSSRAEVNPSWESIKPSDYKALTQSLKKKFDLE